MGGGTPTTLTAEQMDRVLTAFETSFDRTACEEITVEAGRPDTITAEKLAVLKDPRGHPGLGEPPDHGGPRARGPSAGATPPRTSTAPWSWWPGTASPM